MRGERFLFLFFLLTTVMPVHGKRRDFILTSRQTVTVACSPSEEPVVHTALEILKSDVRAVLSTDIRIDGTEGAIRVGTIGKSELINQSGVELSALEGRKQAFLLAVSPEGQLVVAGSDKYGTAYGILEISRLLGVSPWKWWADVTPEKKEIFTLPSKFRNFQSPSVEYRGIFVNDEDWGLMPWSSRTYEPTDVKGEIGPRTSERILSCCCGYVPIPIGRLCMNVPFLSS